MKLPFKFPPSFAKSWKTTVVGIASAMIGVVQAAHLGWRAALHDPSVQMAMIAAALGFLSKDLNVTGGSSGQPSTPAALAEANQAPAKGADAPVKP